MGPTAAANNVPSLPMVLPQLQAQYTTITLSQLQATTVAAAIPTETSVP